MWELLVDESCENYYYTNKIKLEKAKTYFTKRNIPFSVNKIDDVNKDFGNKFTYSVDVCLINNAIEFEPSWGEVREPFIFDYYNGANEFFSFDIASNSPMDEEDLMMIYYTYIEDGIVDEKLEEFQLAQEELTEKQKKLKDLIK